MKLTTEEVLKLRKEGRTMQYIADEFDCTKQNVDLFMTNFLSVSLTKIIALTWEVDFIYDDDLKLFGKDNTSPALQFKSLVGIGIQINKKR